MGPAQSKPKTYDPTKIHDAGVWGGYMSAYRGSNSQVLGKKIGGRYQDYMPIGAGTVSVGAKILQNRQNELYIISARGTPITLTDKNGVPKPNASQILRSDPNYGKGPTVGFLGSPANPKVVMWSAHDMSKSDKFTPMQINSYTDFYNAMENHIKGIGANQVLDSDYGQAAVDPFINHPTDVWTGVGKENAFIGKIGSQMIVPAAESLLDDVVPGASLALDATGVSGKITDWIDSAMNKKSVAYQSAPQYDTNLSSVLHDPRLPMALEAATHSASLWSKQTDDRQLQVAMNLKADTGQQQLAKLKALRTNSVRLYANEQGQKLIKTADLLKGMVGHTDFDFSQIQSGLAAAQTPQQRLNVVSYFSKQIKQKLLPLLQTQSNSAASDPTSDPSQAVSAPTQQQSTPAQGQTTDINGDSSPKQDQHGNTM